MKKRAFSVATATLALGIGTFAVAANHDAPVKRDSNGDGVVTLAEAQSHAAARFAKMDTDGNGMLDRADRIAKRAERFAKADKDGNGELSQAEMTAAREDRKAKRAKRSANRMAQRFARLDSDGSGGLSQAEMAAGRDRAKDRPGGKQGMRKRGQRRGLMAVMRKADSNGDKAVSRTEFDAMVAARFAKVDADGSGTITQEERKAAREARRAARSERQAQRRSRL